MPKQPRPTLISFPFHSVILTPLPLTALGRGAKALALSLALTLPYSAKAQILLKGATAEYIYIAERGDTLIGIAEKFLTEPTAWPRLQQLNRVANPRLLQPATRIRIPLALMRRESQTARIISTQGQVSFEPSKQAAAQPTTPHLLTEGTQIKTGADGFVLLQLADGSLLRIPSQSQARLTRMQRVQHTQTFDTEIQVDAGRVEPKVVPQQATQNRFQIRTPQAVAGVRGTEFRVAYQNQQSTSEVLSGAVQVSGASRQVLLAAGYATQTDAQGLPSTPVALLDAPNLSGTTRLQERPTVRAIITAVPGAQRYRGQIAQLLTNTSQASHSEAGTTQPAWQPLQEAIFNQPEIKFSSLADGKYFLIARAINAQGIEGRDAQIEFELNAQPEPPIIQQPLPNSKVRAQEVVFIWNTHPAARFYHLQVARDPSFQQLAINQPQLVTTEFRQALPLGDYFWRIASDATGNAQHIDPQPKGPFSDVQRFALRAPPSAPLPPQEDAQSLHFHWSGETGQRFLLQIASDRNFSQLLHTTQTLQPQAIVPRPPAGVYFVRTQATDSDGFVGPFSPAQTFEVQARWTSGDGQPMQSSGGIVRHY